MSEPEQTSKFDDALDIIRDSGRMDQATLLRAVVTIIAVLIVGTAFVTSYVGGLHEPKFHRVPIAVLGPPSLAAHLNSGVELSVDRVSSRAEAVSRIDNRHDYGAVIATPTGFDVLTAQAASMSVASALQTMLPPELQQAAGPKAQIRVTDLKPLPSSDLSGITPFYLALSLVVSNYIGAVFFGMAFGVKPVGRRVWWRLLAAATVALVLALSEVGITLAFGAFGGHFVLLTLVGILLGFTVSTVTIGMQSFLGMIGTTIAILVFVVLGNPASGGPFPTQLLPGFWRWIGPYLPAGAGVDLVRDVVYFNGNATTRPLLVLFIWLAIALVFAVLSVRARPMGLQMKRDHDRLEAARSAAAVGS